MSCPVRLLTSSCITCSLPTLVPSPGHSSCNRPWQVWLLVWSVPSLSSTWFVLIVSVPVSSDHRPPLKVSSHYPICWKQPQPLSILSPPYGSHGDYNSSSAGLLTHYPVLSVRTALLSFSFTVLPPELSTSLDGQGRLDKHLLSWIESASSCLGPDVPFVHSLSSTLHLQYLTSCSASDSWKNEWREKWKRWGLRRRGRV